MTGKKVWFIITDCGGVIERDEYKEPPTVKDLDEVEKHYQKFWECPCTVINILCVEES